MSKAADAVARWPLLLGAVLTTSVGVTLITTSGQGGAGGMGLLVLGAVLTGAFVALYARESMVRSGTMPLAERGANHELSAGRPAEEPHEHDGTG